ncbi:flagellar protein FlgN [Schwartzia sp. (in: firmicutes)]|nr:flagellar protein FlgN [Schwartzia sp. (in: firmicutes)]
MWQELVKVLEALTEAYGQLLKIAQEKHAVLVMVQLEKLDKLLDVEQTIIDRIHKLEEERRGVLLKLCKSEKSLRPEMTMKEVTEISPAEYSPRLGELHKKLGDLVEKANQKSEENEFLIKSALGAVQYHLNRIGNSTVEPAYGQKGQEIVTQHKNFDFEA